MSNARSASWCSLLLVVVLAACGSSGGDKSSNPPSTSPSGQSPSGQSTPDESTDGAKKIDACTLLSDEEAVSILGEAVTEKGPGSGVGESVCEWDTATEHSITVAVGSPDTAPGDKLTLDPVLGTPEPVAALNGKGFYVAGQVSFAAGNRDNYLQVVTDVTGDVDRTKMEALAVELAPKIDAAS
jgi:hypothetical protein